MCEFISNSKTLWRMHNDIVVQAGGGGAWGRVITRPELCTK